MRQIKIWTRNKSVALVAATGLSLNGIAAQINVDEGGGVNINDRINNVTIVGSEGEHKGERTLFMNNEEYSTITLEVDKPREQPYRMAIDGTTIGTLKLPTGGNAPIEARIEAKVERLEMLGNGIKTHVLEGSTIGFVYGQSDKDVQLTNDGEIRVLLNVKEVKNNGIIMDYRSTDKLINTENGIINVLSGRNAETRILRNYGFVMSGGSGLKLIDTTDAYNSGRIQGGEQAGLILRTLGGEVTNDGEITNGYSKDNITPAIILNNRLEHLIITNNGAITGSASAIGYDVTDNSTIINNGIIDGDITRTVLPVEDPEGLNSDITLINNAGGVWTGGFKDSTLGQFNFVNEVQTIENHGTIKPKKDNRTGIPTIRSREIINDGTIDLLDDSLTIIGNYTGRPGAQLVTAGKLGGDETPVNSLRITGTVSGDATQVYVNNLGGTGAATVDGILVVRADTVDGEGFSKGERIVAGAYDYDLVKV
ncbi:autotransporter outer membrane beta-barrel domain-containing protein, partial [Salmonella enterica]|nr:autotransporter outer membrane beta-barrel domain-containing protein [Salmonella enterica]